MTTLRTGHPRLISPLTKNPNLVLVRAAIEEVRVHAGIQTSNLATALKDTRRRSERERCDRMQLKPATFAPYHASCSESSRHLAYKHRTGPEDAVNSGQSHMSETQRSHITENPVAY